MTTVTGSDTKVNALINSHVQLVDSLGRLSNAQAATERSLQRFIESLTHEREAKSLYRDSGRQFARCCAAVRESGPEAVQSALGGSLNSVLPSKNVAIIGGGPAGATAAERLACSRQRVLLFEEKVGWEKPCGGGLPHKALRRYPFLVDAACPHTSIRDMELVDGGGESVRLRLREPLAVYSRALLNRMLLDRAEQAGANLIEDRIVDFQRTGGGWTVRGRHRGYRAEYLILAAGARTRLRGLLAPHFSAGDFMLTFGYNVPASDRLLRVQFFDDFEGYCWSFPRTDHLSLGICGKATRNRMPELRERLHAFIKRFGYPAVKESRTEVFSHLLPALSPESWHALDLVGAGWALAGDCAGLVDSLTGEGIYFAMRSGELLAESLLAGRPESYPERVWQDFGRKLALGSRLARLFYYGDFLGEPSTTRLVQFAAGSDAFRNLLERLIEGEQSYTGLALELYKTFGRAVLDRATGAARAGAARAGLRLASEPRPAAE